MDENSKLINLLLPLKGINTYLKNKLTYNRLNRYELQIG